MKFLKLFESYSRNNPINIYYFSQLKGIIDINWEDLIVKTRNFIEFKTEEDKYYRVFFENMGRNEDDLMLEDSAKSKFVEKIKKEFYKYPQKYAQNFKYNPGFLGDIDHYKVSGKFNM